MLNGIVLNSITVTIETLTYRKSIADKLISSSHGYPALTSRSKLLLIFMMFFAILPDYKYNLCTKNLERLKKLSNCAD